MNMGITQVVIQAIGEELDKQSEGDDVLTFYMDSPGSGDINGFVDIAGLALAVVAVLPQNIRPGELADIIREAEQGVHLYPSVLAEKIVSRTHLTAPVKNEDKLRALLSRAVTFGSNEGFDIEDGGARDRAIRANFANEILAFLDEVK